MNFFREYKAYIIGAVLAAFALTIGLNFGQMASIKGALTDTVIEVNGDSIPLYVFQNYYERALAQLPAGELTSQSAREQKKNEALRDLVTSTVMQQQSKKFGILVPDQQVVNALANIPAFQESGRFSPSAYQRALAYQLHSTPQEFEEEQRRQIAIFKLSWLMRSSVRLTDKELESALPVLGPAIQKDLKEAAAKDKKAPAPTEAMIKERLSQELMNWSLSQWYQTLNQHLKVKPHPETLQEVK